MISIRFNLGSSYTQYNSAISEPNSYFVPLFKIAAVETKNFSSGHPTEKSAHALTSPARMDVQCSTTVVCSPLALRGLNGARVESFNAARLPESGSDCFAQPA
jgi:hypothetical protein